MANARRTSGLEFDCADGRQNGPRHAAPNLQEEPKGLKACISTSILSFHIKGVTQRGDSGGLRGQPGSQASAL